MRTLLASILLAIFIISTAAAEVLVTANPLGQGTWAFEIAGMQDSTFLNQTEGKLTSYGGYIAYGLLDNLDLYIDVGLLSSSGLVTANPSPPPATLAMELSGTAYGSSLKYTILEEGEAMPVSVALAARYRTTSQKVTMSGAQISDNNYAQTIIGIGVSKIIVPFIPYLAVAYKQTKEEGSDFAVQTDITVGTAIAWSKQGAVFIEYTSQAIQDKSAAQMAGDHTSGQIAVGVGYALR